MHQKDKIIEKLYDLNVDILLIETEDLDFEQLQSLAQMQNVLSVFTRIMKHEYIDKLENVLNFHFPRYFISKPKPLYSKN